MTPRPPLMPDFSACCFNSTRNPNEPQGKTFQPGIDWLSGCSGCQVFDGSLRRWFRCILAIQGWWSVWSQRIRILAANLPRRLHQWPTIRSI